MMSDVDQTAQIRGSGNLIIQAGRDVNLAAEPKLHLTRYETRRGGARPVLYRLHKTTQSSSTGFQTP